MYEIIPFNYEFMKKIIPQLYNELQKLLPLYKNNFLRGSVSTFILIYLYNLYLKQSKRINVLNLFKLIPYLNKKVNGKLLDAKKNIGNELKIYETNYQDKLPQEGLNQNQILAKMDIYDNKKHDDDKISGVVYHGGKEYTKFLLKVFEKVSWSNPLHTDLFPSIRIMETEILKMAIDMFQGNNKCCGNVTYGGTESLLLMAKTYREWGFYEKNISKPNIVILESGHAAINKAGHYFNIEIRVVPIDIKTGTATINEIKKYVNSNTICLMGSAPSYAHGIIDPIEDMANFAFKKNIGLHVDCCMGGFLVPFLRNKINRKFDFSLKGVTSISADTHKYGFSLKGNSIIMYNNFNIKKYQHFSKIDWNGGIYATPTIMGSKSGALIASAWAAMLYHGKNKYTQIAENISQKIKLIKDEISQINDIEIIGDPNINIIAFKSNVLNIYRISSSLSDKGWHLNILQNPDSFHFCVTYKHLENDSIIQNFISDFKTSINEVRNKNYDKISGSAALYGLASNISQESITDEIVNTYINFLSNDNIF